MLYTNKTTSSQPKVPLSKRITRIGDTFHQRLQIGLICKDEDLEFRNRVLDLLYLNFDSKTPRKIGEGREDSLVYCHSWCVAADTKLVRACVFKSEWHTRTLAVMVKLILTRISWNSSRKFQTSYNTCSTKVAPLKANPLTKMGYHAYKATKTFRAWSHGCRIFSSLLKMNLLDLLSASRRVDKTFAGTTIRIVDLGGWFPGCYYLLRKQYSSQWKVFL